MPTKQIALPWGQVTRVAEVNVRRETLTIWNWNNFRVILADHDAPFFTTGRYDGIPLPPATRITLERKDGDNPDRAWYIYAAATGIAIVHEGMRQKERKWW